MARQGRGDTMAAAVMMAGSASFLAGAFMPISRIFVEQDPQRKLVILLADPVQWRVEQLLLAAGTVVLPAGVVMLARRWGIGSEPGAQEPPAGRRLAQGAAVLLVTGAAPFLVALAARFTDPQGFGLGSQPVWLFHGYMWLSLAGMAALGGALLARARNQASSGISPREPRWPGWLNLGGAAAFAAVLVATGDFPPLLIYGVELATGAALILHRRRDKDLGRGQRRAAPRT